MEVQCCFGSLFANPTQTLKSCFYFSTFYFLPPLKPAVLCYLYPYHVQADECSPSRSPSPHPQIETIIKQLPILSRQAPIYSFPCLTIHVNKSTFVTTATALVSPSTLSVTTAALFHSKNLFKSLNAVSFVISTNCLFPPFSSFPTPNVSICSLPRSVTTSLSLRKSNMTSSTGDLGEARP